MNIDHINLFPNSNCICVEVEPDESPQPLSIKGEIHRIGPFVARLELEVEVPCEDKLVAFLHHLVRFSHDPFYGCADSYPGGIEGHIVVQDPCCDGNFPGGKYRVVMWIADHPSFHGVDGLDHVEYAAGQYDSAGLNVALSLDNGDGVVHRWESTEVPGCWLSYRQNVAAVGWPVGLHARFIGPDLFEVPMGNVIQSSPCWS